MNVLFFTRTLTKYDAVCNDVEAMYNLLSGNHKCSVYYEHTDGAFAERIEEDELTKLLDDAECLIIYHHSIYWEGGELLLSKAKGKIVFRYHNITPPDFFEKYSDFYVDLCGSGRKQTGRFAHNYPDALWLCDSEFNANDLNGVMKDKICVCPPFNKTEQWTKIEPDRKISDKLGGTDEIKLLFVGRNAPNKGHLFLIDVIYCYTKLFDLNITLQIIGQIPKTFDAYYRKVICKVDSLGLRNNIGFIDQVNDSQLLAYYMSSDFFISASEHEGFMVPLAEAQYLGLPVIARSKAAVPETLGDDQVILGDDPVLYASAINVLYNNPDYCNILKQNGERNFRNRFSYSVISSKFEEFLSRI